MRLIGFGPVVFDCDGSAVAASMFARLLARGIDSFIAGSLAAVIAVSFGRAPLWGDGVVLPAGVMLFPIVWAVTEFVYDLACETLIGRTLGKLIVGLCVVEEKSGGQLSKRVALTRSVCPLAAFVAPFAGVYALALLAFPVFVFLVPLADPFLDYLFLAPYAVTIVVKLSFLGAARDTARRSWHDRRAHTVVIVDALKSSVH